MTIERQVVSFGFAEKLKINGYPQEDSLFYWKSPAMTGTDEEDDMLSEDPDYFENNTTIVAGIRFDDTYEYFAAPTAGELGETFQLGQESHKSLDKKNGWCGFLRSCDIIFRADTEADVRAKMWIYLKKNTIRVIPEILGVQTKPVITGMDT